MALLTVAPERRPLVRGGGCAIQASCVTSCPPSSTLCGNWTVSLVGLGWVGGLKGSGTCTLPLYCWCPWRVVAPGVSLVPQTTCTRAHALVLASNLGVPVVRPEHRDFVHTGRLFVAGATLLLGASTASSSVAIAGAGAGNAEGKSAADEDAATEGETSRYSIQTCFDLLGELCKFNMEAVLLLEHLPYFPHSPRGAGQRRGWGFLLFVLLFSISCVGNEFAFRVSR